MPPPTPVAPKPPSELAREALAYRSADFLFSGALEGGFNRGIGPVTDFVTATAEAGASAKTPLVRVAAPLIVKVPKIGTDTAKAAESISGALNLGVSGLMFVEIESAAEVRGPRGDALHVEGRHAFRLCRCCARALGHDRAAVPAEGRSLALES